uniref:Biogenesis of lysosome-related organelles complex 1 subunit 2 n=1 Tax=Strongyloides venezuelensis TaxID=75913 RepID=A0A0K0FRS6_STRVS
MSEEIKQELSSIDDNHELFSSLKNLSSEDRQLVFDGLTKTFFKYLNDINNNLELGTAAVQGNIFDIQKYLLSEINDIKKSLFVLNAKLDQVLLNKN